MTNVKLWERGGFRKGVVLAWVESVTKWATLSSFLHILLGGKSQVFFQNMANGICHRCSGILREFKMILR